MKSWKDQIAAIKNSTEAVRAMAYKYIASTSYFSDTKEYAENIISSQDAHEYKWAMTHERDLIQNALEFGYAWEGKTEYERLVLAEIVFSTIEIREKATGKKGVANTWHDRVAVYYGEDDGSNDKIISAEDFNWDFEITEII